MGALLKDTRTVRMISWQAGIDGPGYLRVGQFGVKSIEVESVNGLGADVAWFAVRWDDGTFSRYNSAYLDNVEYLETE